MSYRSLEEALQAAGNPVEMAAQRADRRRTSIRRSRRVHELARRAAGLEGDLRALQPVAPHDGPVRRRPRRAQAALRSRRQHVRELRARTRRSSSSRCNHDGYVIGDGILFYLEREPAQLRRPRRRSQLGAVPRRDRRLRCRRSSGTSATRRHAAGRAGRAAVSLPGAGAERARRSWRRLNGGPVPEIKFFNMGEHHHRRAQGPRAAPRHGRAAGLRALGPVGRRRGGPRGDRRGRRGLRPPRGRRPRVLDATRSSRAGFRRRCRRSSPATR